MKKQERKRFLKSFNVGNISIETVLLLLIVCPFVYIGFWPSALSNVRITVVEFIFIVMAWVVMLWTVILHLHSSWVSFNMPKSKFRYALEEIPEDLEYFRSVLDGNMSLGCFEFVLYLLKRDECKAHRDILIEYLKTHPQEIFFVLDVFAVDLDEVSIDFTHRILDETYPEFSKSTQPLHKRSIFGLMCEKNNVQLARKCYEMFELNYNEYELGEILSNVVLIPVESDDDTRLMEYLIDLGADVNWQHRKTGASILHMAMTRRAGHDRVRILLEAGANYDLMDYEGYFPRAYGARYGRINSLEVLGKYDSKVTPLIFDIARREISQFTQWIQSNLHDDVKQHQSQYSFDAQIRIAEATSS